MNTTPIASELSFLVWQKQQAERNEYGDRIAQRVVTEAAGQVIVSRRSAQFAETAGRLHLDDFENKIPAVSEHAQAEHGEHAGEQNRRAQGGEKHDFAASVGQQQM